MLDVGATTEIFPELDSTLLEARRRAARGEYGPTWLVARRQTAGRGRRGRSWTSVEGNLMATYLGLTDAPPKSVALLGFACGVALAQTAEAYVSPGRVALKWPNDLFIDGAKAAGLMIDCASAGGGRNWLALSFGVNLAGGPPNLDQPTASLAAAMGHGVTPPSPEAFLEAAKPMLIDRAGALQDGRFAEIRREWLARAFRLGEEIEVEAGAHRERGRFAGISERGELELETAQGVILIAAGDILLAPARS